MTLEELNQIMTSPDAGEFIRVCEARQRKALSKIADQITDRGGIRLVLITGGSSAGKTTTAKRLCTQLRVNGAVTTHLSTDDYFVGDKRNPRDENGEFDYETVACVDRVRLAQDINALLAGETIHPRRFDFQAHDGYDSETTLTLPPNGVVVLEGLHALNPILTEGIDDRAKFRVFIEPKTQPIVFALTRLPSRDARLIRRMVRDNQYRKMDPEDTFRMWHKVIAGEDKWINPFRPSADVEFDSALPYELAILKHYALGLLERHCYKVPEDEKARMLRDILTLVEAADPSKVPGDSILRETIGGSQLEY